MSIVHLLCSFTMPLLRPRVGSARFFGGAQERETSSAGELVAGFTLYTDSGDGPEQYEVNYVTLGARSDTMQNALQAMQGDDLTIRRVGETEADEAYVGSLKENEGRAVNPDGKPGLKIAEKAAA